jgi:hypothetical protein
MKKLVLVLFILIGIVSCSKEANDKIQESKVELGGFQYDPLVKKPVQVEEAYYQIAPTWGQAFHYASKRGDHVVYIVLGSLFLAAFVALFYGKAADASWLPKFLNNEILFGAALFLLITSAVTFFTTHASEVKWQNDKWVKKEVYDKAIDQSGSTQPIWDSLEANHLIIGGPWK